MAKSIYRINKDLPQPSERDKALQRAYWMLIRGKHNAIKLIPFKKTVNTEQDAHVESYRRTLANEIANLRCTVRVADTSEMCITRLNVDHKAYFVPGNLRSLMRALEELRARVRSIRKAAKSVEENWKTDDKTGLEYATTGKVFKDKGSIVKLVKEIKYKKIEWSKKPKTSDRYVGIEIEFYSPLNDRKVMDKIIEHKLEDFINLKDDGSIKPPSDENTYHECNCDCDSCADGECCDDCIDNNTVSNFHTHEFNVLCKQSEVETIVNKVGTLLTEIEADVNNSCGLHVHLDVRNAEHKKVYSRLVRNLDLLAAMQPASRRSNTYCELNKTSRFPTSRMGSRYRAVNPCSYSEHRTIEVRLHTGTVNAEKIIAWVKVLSSIAYQDCIRTPRSLAGYAKRYGWSKELTEYVRGRLTKFAKDADNVPFVKVKKTADNTASVEAIPAVIQEAMATAMDAEFMAIINDTNAA